MYAVAPTIKTVAKPESPLIVADKYKTYTDHLKYITSSVTIISKHAPKRANCKAGFRLPPLSVQGPHRGAKRREGMTRQRF